MGRTSYALMSLTAAVPGLVLAGALTWAFLNHSDTMPGLLPAVAGIAWLVALLMAVTPVGILLFSGSKSAGGGRKEKAAAAAPAESVAVSEADESFVADEAYSDEMEVADDDWNEGDSAVDFEAASGDEFEFEDDSSSEFDAEFDFDDDAKR